MVCLSVSGQHARSKSARVSASTSCCMPQTAVHTKHLRWVSTGPGRSVGPLITRPCWRMGSGSGVIMLVCACVCLLLSQKTNWKLEITVNRLGRAINRDCVVEMPTKEQRTRAGNSMERATRFWLCPRTGYRVALPIGSVSPDPGPIPGPGWTEDSASSNSARVSCSSARPGRGRGRDWGTWGTKRADLLICFEKWVNMFPFMNVVCAPFDLFEQQSHFQVVDKMPGADTIS